MAALSAAAPRENCAILQARCAPNRLPGAAAIGHTRWATHGAPTVDNAHPHVSGGVAVVHNGIIENFQELRAELEGKGHVFTSETDTEVIAHLVHDGDAVGKQPARGRPRRRFSVCMAHLRWR